MKNDMAWCGPYLHENTYHLELLIGMEEFSLIFRVEENFNPDLALYEFFKLISIVQRDVLLGVTDVRPFQRVRKVKSDFDCLTHHTHKANFLLPLHGGVLVD